MLHEEDQLPDWEGKLKARMFQAEQIERETLFHGEEDLEIEELRAHFAAFDALQELSSDDPEVQINAGELMDYFVDYKLYLQAYMCALYTGDRYADSRILDVFDHNGIEGNLSLETAKEVIEEMQQRLQDAIDEHSKSRNTTSSRRIQPNP